MVCPPFLQSALLPVSHGFFSREGGISSAPYDTLNGGVNTDDAHDAVHENRQRIAAAVQVHADDMMALHQIHGKEVHIMRRKQDEAVFRSSADALPKGDALVTDCPDIALSIATADCAPVLFSSADGGIVGAAHAGWRGAVAGVLEATVGAMRALRAEGIRAVIGPCIGPDSYEIGADMRQVILAGHPRAEVCFTSAMRSGHYLFDLPAFCLERLRAADVEDVSWLGHDTLVESRFFSHRRACLAGDSRTGRQLAVIRAKKLAN